MARSRQPMTWALITVGALAGLVGVVALVGAFLPRDHTARVTIDLAASQDRVWAMVSDFAGTAKWRADLRSVEMQPASNGPVRWVEVSSQGRTPFELISQAPPSRQVVRVVDDGLPFGGTWTWSLAASGGGTRVTIEEAGFIRNPVFRVMSRLFFKPSGTAEQYLRSLAAALGESAKPVVVRER